MTNIFALLFFVLTQWLFSLLCEKVYNGLYKSGRCSMWINLDELLDLPKVTVVNYEEIEGVLFLKLKMKNEK